MEQCENEMNGILTDLDDQMEQLIEMENHSQRVMEKMKTSNQVTSLPQFESLLESQKSIVSLERDLD
jgi:hypothetical protein